MLNRAPRGANSDVDHDKHSDVDRNRHVNSDVDGHKDEDRHINSNSDEHARASRHGDAPTSTSRTGWTVHQGQPVRQPAGCSLPGGTVKVQLCNTVKCQRLARFWASRREQFLCQRCKDASPKVSGGYGGTAGQPIIFTPIHPYSQPKEEAA